MSNWGGHLQRVRGSRPLVHNITNFVAMNTSANVLLALGASPAMVHGREEVGEFASLADALCINIGTVDAWWSQSMEAAAAVMQANARPWLVDPVGVGATQFRRSLCSRLMALGPTVVKGNASEILALAGFAASAKGVDSGDPIELAEQAARELAKCTHGIVVATGAVDYITDGQRCFRVANGHELMTRVTALGCALASVVTAFVAGTGGDRLEATVAALAYYGLAGEVAAENASAPGSFAVQFLDALYRIDADMLDARARVWQGGAE